MKYFIVALDGTDADAPARRQAVRDAHIEGVKVLKDNGQVVAGGALLSDDGGMIGSGVIVDFDTPEELDHWLKTDPYVTGDVWRDIKVYPFRQAV